MTLELPLSVTLPAMWSFWTALLVGFAIMFPVLKLLKSLKSRQTISEFVPEHKAKEGTPTMGGIIILGGVLLGLAVAAAMADSTQRGVIIFYLVLMVAFAVIGFLDDFVVPRLFPGKRGLGWKQKILLEVLLATVPLLAFAHTDLKQTLAAVFVILFFANAYNFTDGLDGLAGGVGVVLFAGVAGLALLSDTANSAAILVVSVALIGGSIPFLFLNAPPAKVFMGDVGSLPIGAALGLMFWQIGFSSHGSGPILASFCMSGVMVAGIVPVPLQIASVKLRKKRLFRKTPIHHAFQELGIAETRIVSGYLLVQLMLTVLGLTIFLLVPEMSFGLQVPVGLK